MTLTLSMPGAEQELKPRITVFGVGGAGGNAVNNMIEKELDGVEFVVANTDAQALQQSKSSARIQLGVRVTEGLGAGARPAIGASAAEESIEEIVDRLAGSHMCFITAGMGGGTGTGAAPIIAQAARELGVLTVGVVTKPFQFEGAKRMRQAEEGVEALQKVVDTLIIIPNQNLFRLANERTTFTEAFSLADDVLYQGVKGVTDLMVRPGLINLDFADVRAVMDEMGKAMMGTGESTGEERAVQAAEAAIANPLLDEISLRGARGVLINVTGGYDLTLFELDEAANRIREEVDPEANIIVGSTLDPKMEGTMRVSVVATGIDAVEQEFEMPVQRRRLAEPLAAAPEAVVEEAPAPAPMPQPTAYQAPVQPEYDTSVEEPSFFNTMEEQESDAEAEAQLFEQAAPQEAHWPSAMQDQAAQHSSQPVYLQEPAPRAMPEPRQVRSATPSSDELSSLMAAAKKAEALRAPRPTAVPQPEAEDRSRFSGIGSLINRMTGQSHDPETPLERREPYTSHPRAAELDGSDEEERIEIPAFLRRQAN